MIDKHELRIGNRLKIFDSEIVITRLGKSTLGYSNTEVETSATYELLNPIPLTPELLKAAGFESHEFYNLNHPVLKCRWVTNHFLGDELITPFLRFDSIIKRRCTDIYFLHQLQNIYHALTGTELTINQLTK